MTREAFHVLANQLVHTLAQRDFHTWFAGIGGTIDLAAVDLDVTVHNELTSSPNRAGESSATHDIIEPAFEILQENFAGIALAATSFGEIAAELSLEHAVVVAQLLLLILADAVWLRALAAKTVHARWGELSFGRVLRDVRNWNTDATGEFDFRTDVACHE